jgi:hypothetical protein
LCVYAIHHLLNNVPHSAVWMAVPQVSKGSREANREFLNSLGQPLPLALGRRNQDCAQRSDDGVQRST